MIIKSISHTGNKKAARKLIKYIFDGRKSLEDPDGKKLIFKQHLRGYDKDKWAKQFEDLEANRKSHYGNKSVVAYHEVVSFSDKSTQYLSRSIIKDLIGRYIKMRTNGQMLCAGAVHFEKGNKNWHAHLVFSGIKTTDFKSARISKTKLADIKTQLQQYQIEKYPQLEDSIVRHGLKKKN